MAVGGGGKQVSGNGGREHGGNGDSSDGEVVEVALAKLAAEMGDVGIILLNFIFTYEYYFF